MYLTRRNKLLCRSRLFHYVVPPVLEFGRRYLCTGQVAELVRLVKSTHHFIYVDF